MSETLFAQANPTGITGYATTTENGSYGVYFTVSHACTLTAIWFYSPSGASSLPTSTALYSTAAGTSGTLLAQNSSPSWSGAAGSGWVRDGSFPATALSTGTTYVGQYYSASFKQGYLYTGSFPGPLYPATSSPSGLATAAAQYFGGDSNAPYLNSANGFPSSTLGAGVNWLCDVEVSLPVSLPTAAQPPYQPPAWHPASGPGMPGGEPFASYAAASYNPLIPAEVPQPGPFRLFPATNGPSTAASNSGDWISGVAFQATEGGQWLEGYWWWVCASGQSTSPVKCALWNAYQPASVSGTLITGSVVTSGTLTAGAWNWIPLATPVPLAVATTYIAAIGVNGNYPDTAAQFGSGDPYAAGIADGPLSAFSAQSGSNPDPYTLIGNGIYSTAGTDPSVTIPGTESATGDNLWVDVQVSGTVPAGYAGPFPIWPAKYDSDTHTTPDSSVNYVVGTEFWLAEPCAVNSVRYFSPPGTAQLATEVTIWNVVTQAAVYDNTSPSWSGAAASGWVSCTLTGVTLPPGAYRVTVFNNAGSPDGWSAKRFGYWGGGGLVPGGGPQVTGNGITLGPLFVPSTAQAGNCYEYDTSGAGNTPPFSFPDGLEEPGQCVFAESGGNTYPSLYVDAAYQNYWVDISVTLTAQQGSGTAAGGGLLAGAGAKSGAGAGAVLSGGALAPAGVKGALASSSPLSGGALKAAGTKAVTGHSGITAAGAASGHGTKAATGTGTAAAAGALTSAGAKAATGTSRETATGTLSDTGTRAVSGTGKTAGAGSAAGAGSRAVAGSGSLASGGELAAAGEKGTAGTSGTSGGGTFSASAATPPGTSAVTAGGTLAASGIRAAAGTSAIAASGGAGVAGVKGADGTSGTSGSGVVSAAATQPDTGTGVITAGGTLAGSGTRTGTGSGAAAAGGTIRPAGSKAASGTSGLAGSAALGASQTSAGTGSVPGAGTLRAAGFKAVTGSSGISGTAAASGAGRKGALAYGTVAATGSAAAAGARHAAGTGTLAGCGQVAGAGALHVTGTSGIAACGMPGAVQAPQVTGSSAICGSGWIAPPPAAPLILFSVTTARQLWSVTTARQQWSVRTARNT